MTHSSKIEKALAGIYGSCVPEAGDLEFLLGQNDPGDVDLIFRFADDVRRRFCGDGILLRGIVEFSNRCGNSCSYCGLHKNNRVLERYTMSASEIEVSVGEIDACGIRTAVLQSGEDEALDAAWLAELVGRIKERFDIAVTLSVGERRSEDYRLWREAGADRYLLKIETSDRRLYESLHPGMSFERRKACLAELKALGYQTGSGSIVGLRGQTPESIARDILFFKEQGFDMIGIGPFIAHQETDLKNEPSGDAVLTLKALALTRIVTRNAHLPATTALGSLRSDFRKEALACGANVLMPNFTPQRYRRLYEIYPGKRCVEEPSGACVSCMGLLADSIGRVIEKSRGDSLKIAGAVI